MIIMTMSDIFAWCSDMKFGDNISPSFSNGRKRYQPRRKKRFVFDFTLYTHAVLSYAVSGII